MKSPGIGEMIPEDGRRTAMCNINSQSQSESAIRLLRSLVCKTLKTKDERGTSLCKFGN
jgi:hypothetical protein